MQIHSNLVHMSKNVKNVGAVHYTVVQEQNSNKKLEADGLLNKNINS